MKQTLLILVSLCFAASASAQSISEKTGANSVLGISPSTVDFVKSVAMSDLFEIESNQLGQERGTAEDKAFAIQMVTDHTKTSDELKSLVSSGKVKAEIPVALDNSHQAKIEKLRSFNGTDFSSNFRSMQVDAHRIAVDLFERYSKGGDNADLKAWAGRTLPTLKHHREMSEALYKAD